MRRTSDDTCLIMVSQIQVEAWRQSFRNNTRLSSLGRQYHIVNPCKTVLYCQAMSDITRLSSHVRQDKIFKPVRQYKIVKPCRTVQDCLAFSDMTSLSSHIRQ